MCRDDMIEMKGECRARARAGRQMLLKNCKVTLSLYQRRNRPKCATSSLHLDTWTNFLILFNECSVPNFGVTKNLAPCMQDSSTQK